MLAQAVDLYLLPSVVLIATAGLLIATAGGADASIGQASFLLLHHLRE